MNIKESEFLNKLFATSPSDASELEADMPLLETPDGLTEKLYAISDPGLGSSNLDTPAAFLSWQKITSVAASILMVVVMFQVYQQQQTLKQLEQAQLDLATALRYLGEANEITRAQMINSLNSNIKKAAVVPVIEIGREAVLPTLKSIESATKPQTRTL